MSLDAEFERVSLPLENAFTISRGTQTAAENVIVRVTDDAGMTGVGGAAPSTHYGETADTVAAVMPDLLDAVERVGDPHAVHEIEAELRGVVNGNPAARCAVSIAVHDLAAKRLGVPLYRLWGFDPTDAPKTSFTIGLDETDRVREKAADAVAAGHDVLKIKLGTDRDRELIDAVREAAPDARLRVDANEAWTPKEAVAKSAWLADRDVEFVEQPVSADDPEGLRYAYERAELPIAADESCVTAADVPAIADRCDIEPEADEGREPLRGAAGDRRRAGARSGGDVRLYDRVERLHRGGGAARAPAGLRRPRRVAAARRGPVRGCRPRGRRDTAHRAGPRGDRRALYVGVKRSE